VHPVSPRLLQAARNLREDWYRLIRKRRPQGGRSQYFIGPIATGDKVVAIKELLERYRSDWPKLIGIEMEAGGVVSATFQSVQPPGFLMIRGVSDLADKNKDDSWRQYACHAAAAFAIALLQSGPVPFSKQEEIDNQPGFETVEIFRKACEVLVNRTIDLIPKYNPALYVSREAINREFSQFLITENPCLLIQGEAGAGKTNFLCHLTRNYSAKIPTLFFRGTVHMLGRLGFSRALADELAFSSRRSMDPATIIQVLDGFLKAQNSSMLIFIDGINENRDIEYLKESLGYTVEDLVGTRIKLCLSCRDVYGGPYCQDTKIGSNKSYSPPFQHPCVLSNGRCSCLVKIHFGRRLVIKCLMKAFLIIKREIPG
jgi:hypothetical protein